MKRLSKEKYSFIKTRIRLDNNWARLKRLKRVNKERRESFLYLRERRRFSNFKVRLPEIISLGSSASRKDLLLSLNRLKSSSKSDDVSIVTIDFSNIRQLNSCGTLLLVAEIERILENPLIGGKLKAIYPTDEVVEQLFQHIGLLKKLGLESRVEQISSSNVKPWLYVCGSEGDLESIPDILPSILTEGNNMELRMALLSGMAEAVANSSEHAYISARNSAKEDVSNKWWLFARQIDDEAVIAICDLGVGIPGTIEANWNSEFVEFAKTRIGMKKEDHKVIELALKVGRTRTDDSHRGKGLKDIIKVVKEHGVGRLMICSNRGIYTINNDESTKIKSFDCEESIMGTIIQWKIPIEAFGLISENRHG